MNELIEGLTVLLSWQIFATAIAIYAVITLIKKVVPIILENAENSKLYKIVLSMLNVLLGIGIAFHPTFLPGNTLTGRIIAGIVAGFLSNYFYQFIKRFFESKKID